MQCRNCGTQNNDGAAFCVSCGASLADEPSAAEEGVPVAEIRSAKKRNWFRRHPVWSIVIGLLLVLVVAGIATGGGSGSSSTRGTSGQPVGVPTPHPNPGSANNVKSVVENGETFTYLKSQCTGKTCVVSVKQGETTFGSEHEVIEPMFPVFKGLFAMKPYKSVKIIAYGPVTSIGGKTSTAKTASVRCTQAANKQIDWDNIDMNGIHALCTEQQYVNFSK
jgi:hypothetical protein